MMLNTVSTSSGPDIVVTGTMAYDTIHTPTGSASEVLGGSATYFALAARLFNYVGIIAVVGNDFRSEDLDLLKSVGIDLTGVEQQAGPTFRWEGRYNNDLSEATTLETQLNVLASFQPAVPALYHHADILFLANLAPDIQLNVLNQYHRRPRMIAADTMNFWIENARPDLLTLLKQIDLFIINEGEARLLTGEHNVVKAARAIQALGSFDLVIKRGGYGAILFHNDEIFAIPSYPLEEVIDTTGAGDSFAGGFLGALSIEPTRIRKAMIMGNLVASFTVEAFSVKRLVELTWPVLKERYLAFREIVRLEDL